MSKISIIFYKNESSKVIYSVRNVLREFMSKSSAFKLRQLWHVSFGKTVQIVKQAMLHLTNVHSFYFICFWKAVWK